jgi:hypothetical protein
MSELAEWRRRRVLRALGAAAIVPGLHAPTAAGNPIVAENARPGTGPEQWDVDGAGDTSVMGFAVPFTVPDGALVQFAVDGPAASIDVYRLGFYGGAGARLHARLTNRPSVQPEPVPITAGNGGVQCINWAMTSSWRVPRGTVSGVFLAVVHSRSGGRFHMPFVVRNDDRAAAVVVKTSDATWHAYNYYGGSGERWNRGATLYGVGDTYSTEHNRAFAVSWARPLVHRATRPSTALFNAEYALIRFLEESGVDVQYIGCQDLNRSVDYLRFGRRVFISSGHDEYWSIGMRRNVEEARRRGTHLVFMSGNESFWRTRFSANRRIMWCFKDTLDGPAVGPNAQPGHVGGQPLDPTTWTGTWRDPRQPGGGDGEVNLTGTVFRMNGINDVDAVVSGALFRGSPFWRGTAVGAGQDVTLPRVIGFEADEVGPVVAAVLADTRIQLSGSRCDDAGQHYDGSGPMRWGVVLRRENGWSGAVTVGFGTCQWSWMLSAVHERLQVPVSDAARQATLNLLTDMGAPPATPPAGLVAPRPVAWWGYGL